MWYSYYVNSSGEWTKSKKFEDKDDFYNYAAKHPSQCFVLSTSEFDPLGRAYCTEIEKDFSSMKYEKKD